MKCDKTSFCVYDSGFRKEWEWALNIRSVIVFGRIRPVTDPDLAKKYAENCVINSLMMRAISSMS